MAILFGTLAMMAFMLWRLFFVLSIVSSAISQNNFASDWENIIKNLLEGYTHKKHQGHLFKTFGEKSANSLRALRIIKNSEKKSIFSFGNQKENISSHMITQIHFDSKLS